MAISSLSALVPSHTIHDTPNLHTKDLWHDEGLTPLHVAARRGHLEVARALVKAGAAVDHCTPIYGSPLTQAILAKEEKMIDYLTSLLPDVPVPHLDFSDSQEQVMQGDLSLLATKPQDVAIAEIATALFAIKFHRKPNFQSIKTEVLQKGPLPNLLLAYMKHEKVRRNFYHIWKISWNLSYGRNIEVSQKIVVATNQKLSFVPVSGGYPEYYCRSMAKSTDHFARTFARNLHSIHGCLNELQGMLYAASDQHVLGPKHFYQRYRNYKPLFINVEFDRHALVVLIWENYFVICNRGIGRNLSIQILRFRPKFLTQELLAKLMTQMDSESAYRQLLFTELAEQLEFQSHPFEKHLEGILYLPPQKIGNCSWENPETAVYAFLMLEGLKANGMLHYLTYHRERAAQQLEIRQNLFDNWLLFQQLKSLKKYLESSCSQSRYFVANYDMFDEVKREFHKLKTRPSSHPDLVAEMELLERTYPILQR